ncbi:MAG: FUSC family protein [Geobacteraceae bacterium]|nr:FUSC family protein [Geobacteraceae bacterium]
MTTKDRSFVKSRMTELAHEIWACAASETGTWLFVFKTTLAALLAMWISMRFELGQPVTAMVTVFLIMQPQSGPVLMKSLYRIAGTLSGALACLALFALFPQDRVLFLLGLSIWVGVCTAGAPLLRNFRCYAFVLAGYTAAMIGMSIVSQPEAFFTYAVNRFTEVVVGILCAGLVSDLVFPRHLGSSISSSVRDCYTEFIGFAHELFSGKAEEGDIKRIHLRFISNTLALESLRGAAFWEASEFRGRDARLRRLNADFMAMSTTTHSLHKLMRRLRNSDSRAAPALNSLLAALDTALLNQRDEFSSAKGAHSNARKIAEFRKDLTRRVKESLTSLGREPDNPTLLDFDTGTEMVRRFTREMHDYTRNYISLNTKSRNDESCNEIRFVSRTDPAMALLNGVRAMLAVLLVAVFWILTAWPYGASAVMMVAIACALFAPAPDPARAIKAGLFGGCIALPAAFVCKFFILPAMDGFVLLCMALAPFLLLSAWLLVLNRKTMMIGLGFCCMFCFMIDPGNTMRYNPIKLINFGWSQILGQAAATAMFAIFAPVTSPWFKRRIPLMLRRQVNLACFAPLAGLEQRFESGTRDIMQRIAATGKLEAALDRHIVDWMFFVLETGRAVIHLRRDVETLPRMTQKKNVDACIHAIGELFHQPTPEHRFSAVSIAEETLLSFREAAKHENNKLRLDSILTSLHCIRLALLDNDSTPISEKEETEPEPEGDQLYAS